MVSFRTFSHTLVNVFFPERCLGCQEFNTWLCSHCFNQLPLITEQKCPLCDTSTTPDGATCFKCSGDKENALDGTLVASTYSDPLLRKMIHFYKYRFVSGLSLPLAQVLAQSLIHSHLPTPDIIVPVPLHKRRLRWRGFNHAEKIVTDLDLKIPHTSDTLIRVRYTPPQAHIKKRNARITSIKGAFKVDPKEVANVTNKNILLIDDITTTGATLNECAVALKKAGAARVWSIVIAKE